MEGARDAGPKKEGRRGVRGLFLLGVLLAFAALLGGFCGALLGGLLCPLLALAGSLLGGLPGLLLALLALLCRGGRLLLGWGDDRRSDDPLLGDLHVGRPDARDLVGGHLDP